METRSSTKTYPSLRTAQVLLQTLQHLLAALAGPEGGAAQRVALQTSMFQNQSSISRLFQGDLACPNKFYVFKMFV